MSITYAYSGKYDKDRFASEYSTTFAQVPKFNAPSIHDLLFVVGKIECDKRIADVRWAAYMLATMFVESSHTVRIPRPGHHGHGKPRDRGMKVWRNFAPVEEAGHGKGHGYFLPVKVKKLPNGDVRVTEWDGDQWTVLSGSGLFERVNRHAKRGIKVPTAAAAPIYTQDDGAVKSYFGRGYVQLTWWDNYLSAGRAIGRALDFLLQPELMLERDLAYSVMATGMVTGKSFANGRTFAQYLVGGHTDYVGARDMVNPGADYANKVEVAKLARKFEAVLFASRAGAPLTAGN